jgi:two-component system chemotaxis response regulator CheY
MFNLEIGGLKMTDKKSVLVVDDKSLIRTTIKDFLDDGNFEVVAEAQDGIEAFNMYKIHNPDLVMLDLILPKESGLDALKKIIEFDPNAYVIIVTGLGDRNTLLAVIEAGARDYVLKPFSKDTILDAANRFICQ